LNPSNAQGNVFSETITPENYQGTGAWVYLFSGYMLVSTPGLPLPADLVDGERDWACFSLYGQDQRDEHRFGWQHAP